ncbi:MAG: alpha/beta hydrolase [Pirellulales bacterium]
MPKFEVGRENSGAVELYYEDHGSGKPVLLIHGFPLNGASFEKQTAALLNAGKRVLFYDRRGFGKSSQPTVGYDYDTFAADLHKLIEQLDLHDLTLVGFSMGTGEVARYLSAYGSARVSKAVFIAPIPPVAAQAPGNDDGVPSAAFADIQAGIAADRPAFLEGFFKNFYNVGLLSKPISSAALHASWVTAIGASAYATYHCVETWKTDFRADLPKIKIPTLVIQGDADKILPYEVTGKRLAAAIPGAKLVTVSGAARPAVDACGGCESGAVGVRVMLRAEFRQRVDEPWLSCNPIRVGCVPRGQGNPDIYVLVARDDLAFARIDVWSRYGAGPYSQIAIWDNFIVIGWGEEVHLVDPETRAKTSYACDSYFGSITTSGESLLITDATKLFRLAVSGDLCWESDALGIDGVIVNDIRAGLIYGEGEWDPPGGWRPFTISLATGQVVTP